MQEKNANVITFLRKMQSKWNSIALFSIVFLWTTVNNIGKWNTRVVGKCQSYDTGEKLCVMYSEDKVWPPARQDLLIPCNLNMSCVRSVTVLKLFTSAHFLQKTEIYGRTNIVRINSLKSIILTNYKWIVIAFASFRGQKRDLMS